MSEDAPHDQHDGQDHRRPWGAGGASGVGPAADLSAVLDRAQRLGFLGPGPVADHIDHAAGFAEAAGAPVATALDLGSGGGVPALALAVHWPSSRWVLLEAQARRAAFLEEAVRDLALADRVEVDHRRAEEAGRDPHRRGSVELVTARSFGPPATTAECAAPFLRVRGRVIVSDPPAGPGDRWPSEGLALLDLEVAGHRAGCTILLARGAVDERYPRRNGVPAKRPLF